MITLGGLWVICGLFGAGMAVEKLHNNGADLWMWVLLGLVTGPFLMGSSIAARHRKP
jgi:hypothetical protein